jgi:hypothetical protein
LGKWCKNKHGASKIIDTFETYHAPHTFLLGFPTGCLHRTIKHFSRALAGEKEDFCKGSLSRPTIYFVIVFLYFIFTCIILSKTQKN